jgi:hypothetical protein
MLFFFFIGLFCLLVVIGWFAKPENPVAFAIKGMVFLTAAAFVLVIGALFFKH